MNVRPIELSGERVRLQPLERVHAEALFRAGGDPGIFDFIPARMQTRDDFDVFVKTALAEREAGMSMPFAIFDRTLDRLVGSTRYLDISVPNRSLEIGWTWLDPAVWRTGVNTECKFLLLRHAFEDLGAIRVQFKTDLRNVRSQAAIERIGGVREGVLRRSRVLHDGFVRDSVYFSILDSEWAEVRRRLEAMLCRER